MQDEKNKNILNMPRDTDLDFFAYGILKPGQIAYSKIKDYIDEKTETMIDYPMKHRDGVPILLRKNRYNQKTNGYLFHFNDNKKAYKIICKTFSKQLYNWGTIEIDNKKVNVLFGRNPNNGSEDIESSIDRENFDGKKDPMFREAIELIEENLKTERFSWETGFYKLQMNYMLLWSAIDRYCKLKYNQKNEHDNRIELSKEKVFEEALEKYAKNKYRTIFTTDELIERSFDINNPKWCINYYYTLRCNIVHRGKTSMRDTGMLEEATKELLNIFKYILDDTFDEKE